MMPVTSYSSSDEEETEEIFFDTVENNSHLDLDSRQEYETQNTNMKIYIFFRRCYDSDRRDSESSASKQNSEPTSNVRHPNDIKSQEFSDENVDFDGEKTLKKKIALIIFLTSFSFVAVYDDDQEDERKRYDRKFVLKRFKACPFFSGGRSRAR